MDDAPTLSRRSAVRREEVTLTVAGARYAGWTSVRIERAIDTLTGQFALELTARERTLGRAFPFKAGAAVRLEVGGELLITGWIDRGSAKLDEGDHTLSVEGRDKAADLVDCSAIAAPGSWTNTPILTIARELARPFGIAVEAEADLGAPLRKFSLQPGETVEAALERLARFRAVLIVSRKDGSIAFISPKAGRRADELREGDRIKAASATHDVSERFSAYIVKGQSAGDDQLNGRAAAGPKGEAKDPAVPRYRPLVLVAEDQGGIAALTKRAEWEATVRAGRAQEATLTVPGWRQPDGRLFDFGRTVGVAAPSLFIEADMLVKAVALVQDQGGTVAELTVAPPEAFTQLAVPEEREAGRVDRVKGGKPKPRAAGKPTGGRP